MAISDTQKIDFLWKKVIFGVTESTTAKAGYEETIGSPNTVYAQQIIAEEIPVPAPAATNAVVQYYGPTTSDAIRFTPDPSVAGNRTWIATGTYNNLNTRLTGFVPPSVDPSYLAEVYKTDPSVGANKFLGGTNNNEWVFDYQAGVLTFVNTVPSIPNNELYLVAHRYVGATGLGSAGVNIRDEEATYEDDPVTTGEYTFVAFFSHEPQTATITVEFNGQRLDEGMWSFDGFDLTLDLDVIPYPLEDGDVISARYAFIN